MTTKLVLDTHTLLWYLTKDLRLGQKAREALLQPEAEVVLPTIAVAEALFVVQAGKSPARLEELWKFAFHTARAAVYPLDEVILRKLETLTIIPEMHDRIIAATAFVVQEAGDDAVILTRDSILQASGLVKTLW